jgi:hypothetical protein
VVATTWTPKLVQSKRSWLLRDGTVIQSPPLEETPSGRKVRVIGTDISGYSRDVDSVIEQGVGRVAEEKGTQVWALIDESVMKGHSREAAQKVHLITDSQNSSSATCFWWKFRSPDLPVEAVVRVEARTGYQYRNDLCDQNIHAYIVFQRNVASSADNPTDTSVVIQDQNNWEIQYADYAEREAYRDSAPEILSRVGRTSTKSEMTAIERLLELSRYFESLAEIQIPDGRAQGGTYLTLHSDSTNLTAEAIDSMVAYLDDAPTMAAAAEYYEKMLRVLRNAGLAAPTKKANDFMSALNGGEGLIVDLPVKMVDEDGDICDDHSHTLRVNLATGTFTTTCSNSIDLEHTPQAWQEAVTIASLTGQEDELLAFAREKTLRDQAGSAEKILASKSV